MGVRFSQCHSAITTASEARVKDLGSLGHAECCGFRSAEVRKTQVYVCSREFEIPTPASLPLARAE